MINVTLGFRVFIRFKDGTEDTFRNVTEIHYNFKPAARKNRIAFESSIHATGSTYDISDIAEFEALRETEKAEAF